MDGKKIKRDCALKTYLEIKDPTRDSQREANRSAKIDDQLLELYNKRMEYVHQVGELKNTTGAPIYRPEREQSILNRLKAQNRGKLT
ncbi:MAG TPA: hypothetical protein ENK66_09215, partial [Arcobacter sp.]|nr:hypothetical protein [Arcobacter sp.]